MVETAGSLIEQLLSKSIHAVTSEGFEMKVALFVIAYSLDCYLSFVAERLEGGSTIGAHSAWTTYYLVVIAGNL